MGPGAYSELPELSVVDLQPTSRRTVPLGTVTRYRATTSDGLEREIVHGQVRPAFRPAARSADLTVGTAAPLSVGPDGMMMHLLLRTMDLGVDVVVFGPERGPSDQHIGREERQRLAGQLSLPRSAVAAHVIADRLAAETGSDMSTMLWTGISLGAIKGILFAALAPRHGRALAYGHFTVPVCPQPMDAPDDRQMRRYVFGELGAMFRASGELAWKDMRDRSLAMPANVMRVAQPGLLTRYLRSAPQGSEFKMFTSAWQQVIVNGDVGIAAAGLPRDRPTTYELFDRDNGNPPDVWTRVLADQTAEGSARIVIRHGRHSDAVRLSHQRWRGVLLRRVIDQVHCGTPPDQITHPLG
ncbi:MAG: hypothetical protein ABW328_08965 [Ilumatobacteraceae bacterium]